MAIRFKFLLRNELHEVIGEYGKDPDKKFLVSRPLPGEKSMTVKVDKVFLAENYEELVAELLQSYPGLTDLNPF